MRSIIRACMMVILVFLPARFRAEICRESRLACGAGPIAFWDLLKRIASTKVLRNTRILKRSWSLSRPFETNFTYSFWDIRVRRSPHMDGDGDREGTAGDTDVGCRWCRAHLPATTRAALCGRSPACIRPVSRPQDRQTVRERRERCHSCAARCDLSGGAPAQGLS